MLSNAYFLAKFRFDTAENEPVKNLQNFRKMHFSKMHFPPAARAQGGRRFAELQARAAAAKVKTGLPERKKIRSEISARDS